MQAIYANPLGITFFLLAVLESVTKATRFSGSGGVFRTEARNQAVLYLVCIICRKDTYVLDRIIKKRSKKKLVNCQTLSAGCLPQVPKERKDENLHIRGKDLEALEE